ncbi:glycosyltransferase family 2 protein [Candidatus Gottesmanbacteria bacterium]|nr:glycosyltransferase family 2 protein [Candidatus Gottesmanbacteria bacterium]
MKDLSIIIPTHNEQKNIEDLVKRIDLAINSTKQSYEIIFVDDHSTDQTAEVIEKLAQKYPIKFLTKKGKKGKAYSIIEGSHLADSDYILMIDSDLQYAPESIPSMLKEKERYGVIVAKRKVYKSTLFRRFASRFNSFVFGRLLFGLKTDVQSGLKLFRKEIIDHIDTSHVRAWSLDIPLLFTALELGYKIGSVDITFERRQSGQSKISFLHTTYDIVTGALSQKLAKRRVYYLKPQNNSSMKGAGLVHERKRFITHTVLHHGQSALITIARWQIFFLSFLFGLTVGGFLINPLETAIVVIAILSAVYFVDVLFSLYLTIKSLHSPPEIQASPSRTRPSKQRKITHLHYSLSFV